MAKFKNTADSPPGIQPGETIEVNRITYNRFPIKVPRLIKIGESLETLIIENVKPHWQKGDWLAISEKAVSISQGLMRHESTVRAGWLAKFITLGVLKHKNMAAWSNPQKMQLAIEVAGAPRIIFAAICGAVGKLFGKRGIFWIVAGNHVSEIDGFQGEGDMYADYGILPPKNPQQDCEDIEKQTNIPAIITDANYIDVQVLGVSAGVGLDKKTVREILLDNPLGQGDKMTPFVLVRKIT